MSAHAKSHVSGYGCAVVSIALAIGTRRLLDPVLGTEATLFLAVVVTAWYGGVGPALAAVALGFVWSSFFLIPGGISGLTLKHQAGLALYALTGTAISLLAGSMHAARRRAESTARSERRQAALIDQTYDPVFVWEWRGPIVSWNRGAERLYGFPPEEAVGRVSDDLLHTRPEEAEAFAGALDREGSWEGELHHAARDGHAIIVEK